MSFFDYESVARQANLSDKDLSPILKSVRAEFPTDDMMFELHVLRVCLAIRDGRITLDEAIGRKAA